MTIECSDALKNLVSIWVEIALSSNLSSRPPNKRGELLFGVYQSLDLLRYSIVQQAIKENVIDGNAFKLDSLNKLDEIENQICAITEVTYLIYGRDIYNE